jgi:chromosome segregation ATPase
MDDRIEKKLEHIEEKIERMSNDIVDLRANSNHKSQQDDRLNDTMKNLNEKIENLNEKIGKIFSVEKDIGAINQRLTEVKNEVEKHDDLLNKLYLKIGSVAAGIAFLIQVMMNQ